jgi:hypothetical protein
MPDIAYPFTPRSTKALLPGHYWAVPLSTGATRVGELSSCTLERR